MPIKKDGEKKPNTQQPDKSRNNGQGNEKKMYTRKIAIEIPAYTAHRIHSTHTHLWYAKVHRSFVRFAVLHDILLLFSHMPNYYDVRVCMHACIWWTAIDLFEANARTSFAYMGLFFFYSGRRVRSITWLVINQQMKNEQIPFEIELPLIMFSCAVLWLHTKTKNKTFVRSTNGAHKFRTVSTEDCISMLSSFIPFDTSKRSSYAFGCVLGSDEIKLSFDFCL